MRGEGVLGGRTARVTGGANGIGKACAVRLAAEGAHVTVVDRDEAGVKEVADRIGGTSLALDLLDLNALDEQEMHADILVNNAGFQHVAPVHEFPPEIFANILRLMVEVPFRLAQKCLPGMYANNWGRVVKHLLGAWRAGGGVQVGLCDGQARPRGPVQGRRPRRGRVRGYVELREPGVRTDRPRGTPDRGAGCRACCADRCRSRCSSLAPSSSLRSTSSQAGWPV